MAAHRAPPFAIAAVANEMPVVTLSLPAPSRANQETKAERDPNGCKRALRNDVFQRFLDRIGGVLGGVHHGAAAFRHIVDRRIDIGAGFLAVPANELSTSVIWSVRAEISFFTAVTSFSRRS